MEDGERWLDIVLEPFVLIIADHDDDIGIHLGDFFGQGVHTFLVAGVAAFAHRHLVLGAQIFVLAQFQQLFVIIKLAAERMRRIFPVALGAQVPFLGRRR